MKLSRTLSIAAILLIVASLAVVAGEEAPAAPKDAPVELKAQTVCPVMGNKIDSATYTDIQGQRVYHCCPMCSKALKEDPDKYFKKAAAEGVLFENIQTVCPVSGEMLKEKTSFTDFEGRRIYFCCDGCKAPFSAEPQKYLSKLDAPVEEMKGHEGHMKDQATDKKDD